MIQFDKDKNKCSKCESTKYSFVSKDGVKCKKTYIRCSDCGHESLSSITTWGGVKTTVVANKFISNYF